MKYILVLILILYSSLVFTKTIAEVGNYRITDAELRKEIAALSDHHDYIYSSIKNIALNNLIDKYLIKNYAVEKGIYVDDNELEAFFIQQVGDLPRFQTNGVFSDAKFFNFKNSTEGRNILKAMKEELLITKARTILEESFQISEAELLRQYFIENTKIDIGYALIDKQDIDFKLETFPEEFTSYYRRNKFKHNNEEMIKLNVFVIFSDEFTETAAPIVNRKLTQIILSDTTLTAENTIQLQNDMLLEETFKLARQKAFQVSELLQANANISQEIIESSYLSRNDKLGELPEVILQSAFELNEGDFSEPFKLESGYLVYSVVDKKKIARKDELAIARAVWQEYLTKKTKQRDDIQLREYFEKNFEEFIVPAATVTKIEISSPSFFSSTPKDEYQQKIKQLLERNAYKEFRVSKIVEEYNLTESKETIYLEKFENKNITDDMIAIRMNRGENWGFIPTGKKLIFYKALTYFPEFIPNFKRVSDQLPTLTQPQADSIYYHDYFNEHKRDFRTPDSLQIGGVVYSVQAELDKLPLVIPNNEIKNIYNSRINEFYRERSVKYDYIFTNNKELAKIISTQASLGKDPILLKLIFGIDYELPKNKVISYSTLPDQISKALSKMNSDEWSGPVSYDNGWILLHKICDYKAGIVPYTEIKQKLRKELLLDIADSLAYYKAKVVFDSTSYFSHLSKFVNEAQIFKTEFQDAKLDYAVLGDISEYRTELLRMWKNEKYSGIVKLDNAYAVIFQTDINRSRQLSYEEALPHIVEILNSTDRFNLAKSKVRQIRNEIASGKDPNSLLYYLGGWNVISDLSLTSKIPGVDFSEAIYDDILKHDEGYCSPVIPINKEKLLFYKLLKLNKPSKNVFYYEKEYYEKKLLKQEFDKWKNRYQAKIGIKLY